MVPLCELCLLFWTLLGSSWVQKTGALPLDQVATSDNNNAMSDNFKQMLSLKELEVFSKLLNPNDTRLEQETKSVLAQYLVAQAVAEAQRRKLEPESSSSTTPMTLPSSGNQGMMTSSSGTTPPSPTTTRVTVNPVHVISQVDKILGNVAGGNVVGIVDESLGIRAPSGVRTLVNGILNVIFCNPLDRVIGRCKGSGAGGLGSGSGSNNNGFGSIPTGLGSGSGGLSSNSNGNTDPKVIGGTSLGQNNHQGGGLNIGNRVGFGAVPIGNIFG